VCIGQPARYSGSFIDLFDPDAVQDVASVASLAKAVSICQPAPRYSGSVIGVVQAWVGQKRLNCDILSLFGDVR
jgi:hypothetical protein